MKSGYLLLFIVILGVFVSLANIMTVYMKVSEFRQVIHGRLTLDGEINLTIEGFVGITVNRDSIVWGNGSVNVTGGYQNATLYTQRDDDGVVLQGNWSGANAKGLILENIGSVNATIYLMAGKDAHAFFSSSSNSNEEYKWNITNKETGSCNGGITKNVWIDVNTSSPGTIICDEFDVVTTRDEIYIDLLITVPYDAANIGEQSDTLLITAYPA
ncbi:hypothetical protein GOV14_04405 [Candidatus Pacearchaeota archaeon]|nr:hypothetical protein [Candidatus Pacearchaeota archaeon]